MRTRTSPKNQKRLFRELFKAKETWRMRAAGCNEGLPVNLRKFSPKEDGLKSDVATLRKALEVAMAQWKRHGPGDVESCPAWRQAQAALSSTANGKDILRDMLPRGTAVTLNYDDCEPEPITGHKITKLNGPQIRLGSRWYYLYQLRGGRELLEQWRCATAAA